MNASLGSGKWNRFCTDGLLDGLGHPVSDFCGDFRIVQIRVGGDRPVDGRAAGRFSIKKIGGERTSLFSPVSCVLAE